MVLGNSVIYNHSFHRLWQLSHRTWILFRYMSVFGYKTLIAASITAFCGIRVEQNNRPTFDIPILHQAGEIRDTIPTLCWYCESQRHTRADNKVYPVKYTCGSFRSVFFFDSVIMLRDQYYLLPHISHGCSTATRANMRWPWKICEDWYFSKPSHNTTPCKPWVYESRHLSHTVDTTGNQFLFHFENSCKCHEL